jgi:hypothetical protein
MLGIKKIFIAVIAISILVSGAYAQGRRYGHGTGQGQGGGGQNFNPEMREKMRQFGFSMRGKSSEIRKNLMQSHAIIREEYSKYKMDDVKVKNAMSDITKSQLELLKLHEQNQIDFRAVVNEDQFKWFSSRLQQSKTNKSGNRKFGEQGSGSFKNYKKIKNFPGIANYQTKHLELIKKLQNDSKKLLDLYANYKLDKTQADELIENIHKSQKAISVLSHNFQVGLRKKLSESEFNNLKSKRGIPGMDNKKF